MHLIAVDDPSSFGVVEQDDDGRILRFVEKPAPGTEPSNLINAGTYVFEPSVLDRIPPGRVSIERDTFPAVAAAGRFHGFATDDYWLDAGRPDLYLRANLDLISGARDEVVDGVAPGAVVGAGATVTTSVVGPGAQVGRDATRPAQRAPARRRDRRRCRPRGQRRRWDDRSRSDGRSRGGRRRRQDCRP